MRKLASIQKIERIDPIPGRDQIGLALVEGWHVIVRYDQFLPGDLCIYVEIDSVMPEREEYEFLRSKNFRIRTMKMAGVISQGICFPLSFLPDNGGIPYELGQDVTDLLGVKKYDEYEEQKPRRQEEKQSPLRRFLFRHRLTRPLARLVWQGTKREKAGFPDEVAKTDETRIQVMPWVLEGTTAGLKYDVREKVDGQSATYLLRKRRGLDRLLGQYEFVVCSRNFALPEDDSSYWQMARLYDIEGVLRKIVGKYEWICLQGECVGPKIQGNPYNLRQNDLYCFNLIYPDGKLEGSIAEPYLSGYGLKWVPLVDKEFTLPATVDEMVAYATGQSKINPDVLREGVVVRNYSKNISFKAVSNEYLLKHGK